MPSKTVRPAYFAALATERPDIAMCRAAAYLARAGEAHATRQGLGVGQHLVLKMLDAVGPCSQQVLAEELRIDRSVMVNVCDDLEKSGFVHRRRNPDDRRSYAVTITGEGRERLAGAETAVPSFLDETFAPLTADERAQLTALVSKLMQL
ncbi:MarR family transcriptional regulator [Spirillospora sp. NPDC052269]